MSLDPMEDGRFEAAEAEVESIPLHLRERKTNRTRITKRSHFVHRRPARIAETEKLGDLVEGLAGGVVPGLAEETVTETIQHFEQVGMAAADHQRESRKLDGLRFQNHR